MKILLTIEEYKERAKNVIKETAKQTIAETASDYFKFELLSMLAHKCFTNEIMCVDIVNKMFFDVFRRDRNGNPITTETLRLIDEDEVKEFNSQEWYVKYNNERRKSYRRTAEIRSFEKSGWNDEQRISNLDYELDEAVLAPFTDNCNTIYYLTLEIFKELYGHDYEIDREYKFC